jgi:hypothetical protein
MLKLSQLFPTTLLIGLLFLSTFTRPLFALDQSAADSEIIIQDIEGNIRAQGQVTTNGDGTVTMQVTDVNGEAIPDGEVVTLTPAAGGAALTGTVIGGEVIFAGLTAGTYTVASTSVLVFSSITVGAVTAGTVAAGGAVVGGSALAAVAGVGAVGAGAAIAIDNNNSSSNNTPPLSPFR